MKTLLAALIAGLFGLTSMYAVASPITGKASGGRPAQSTRSDR